MQLLVLLHFISAAHTHFIYSTRQLIYRFNICICIYVYIHLAAGRLPSLSILFIFTHKYVLLYEFAIVLFVICHHMSLLEPLPLNNMRCHHFLFVQALWLVFISICLSSHLHSYIYIYGYYGIYVYIYLVLAVFIYFDLCAFLTFERVKYIYLQLLKAQWRQCCVTYIISFTQNK